MKDDGCDDSDGPLLGRSEKGAPFVLESIWRSESSTTFSSEDVAQPPIFLVTYFVLGTLTLHERQRQDVRSIINQHFVAVKVDFDALPKLVAQLQRAQAILNLPAGLPLTSFITPDGKLYFGAGYLPSEGNSEKQSFKYVADHALKEYANKANITQESFQLEVAK